MKLIKLTLAEVSGQTREHKQVDGVWIKLQNLLGLRRQSVEPAPQEHWDRSVWINPCDVSAVRRYRGYGVLYVDVGELNRLVVSETPEEVVKLLEECE